MQRLLISAIRWYQGYSVRRPPVCRFHPTCSEYAVEAIHVHGARKGTSLAVRRVVRCRPAGKHGFDPVPLLPHEPIAARTLDPELTH